jgi:MraZ protein
VVCIPCNLGDHAPLEAAGTVFQGSTKLTLDAKGRLSMPTRYRDALLEQENEGRITLAPHPDGSILIYPRGTWERIHAQLMASGSRLLRLAVMAHAEEVELDATGRFLVTAELRDGAGLNREVRLLGMGDHFELWDEVRMKAHFAKPDNARALAEQSAAFPF